MRARIITAAATAVLMTFSAAACVADWVYVGERADGRAQVYIDAKSLEREGNVIWAWVKWNYPVPQQGEGFSYQSKRGREGFNCATQQKAIRSMTYFEEANLGRNVTFRMDQPMQWLEVAPETIAEAELKFVCEHAPKTGAKKVLWRPVPG